MAGTEQRVVAMKSPIKGWSQGAVSRDRTCSVNQQWEGTQELLVGARCLPRLSLNLMGAVRRESVKYFVARASG